MKSRRIVLMLIVFWIMTLVVIDLASARSVSLTTTIVVTVKSAPKENLLPNDKNADTVKELAKEQAMPQPYIKQDVNPSGEQVYTITDKL